VDLKQLRQFVILSETLNFRRAAQGLHIAQPALSVSVRKLEEDLGVRLFDRGRRGVSLTSAGAAALPEAYLALEHVAKMREQARAGSEGEVGTVRLAFIGTATYEFLPRALSTFRAKHPGLQVELNELTTSLICNGVAQRTFDIGIVRYPMTPPSDMSMEPVERDRYCLFLPPGHRLAKRKRLSLRDVADEAFVFPSGAQSPAMHGSIMAACQAAGFVPRIAQEAVQIQTVIGLVQSGLGIALLPSVIARSVGNRVEARPLSDSDGVLTGLALLFPTRNLSRAARHFKETALGLAKLAPGSR